MEHIIKVTIINQLMGLEVNDYLHVGETTIVRTTDGYAVCDNGKRGSSFIPPRSITPLPLYNRIDSTAPHVTRVGLFFCLKTFIIN